MLSDTVMAFSFFFNWFGLTGRSPQHFNIIRDFSGNFVWQIIFSGEKVLCYLANKPCYKFSYFSLYSLEEEYFFQILKTNIFLECELKLLIGFGILIRVSATGVITPINSRYQVQAPSFPKLIFQSLLSFLRFSEKNQICAY